MTVSGEIMIAVAIGALVAWLIWRGIQRMNREAAVEWGIDDDAIHLRETSGRERQFSMRFSELREVYIETTAAGPWAEDFFYVLVRRDEEVLRVPLGVSCDIDLLAWLGRLDGFNWAAAIAASGSTEEQVFECWRAG